MPTRASPPGSERLLSLYSCMPRDPEGVKGILKSRLSVPYSTLKGSQGFSPQHSSHVHKLDARRGHRHLEEQEERAGSTLKGSQEFQLVRSCTQAGRLPSTPKVTGVIKGFVAGEFSTLKGAQNSSNHFPVPHKLKHVPRPRRGHRYLECIRCWRVFDPEGVAGNPNLSTQRLL